MQIYIYAWRETAAKSQLPLSKIVCKACYCAPVKISKRPREITKLELSRRCKKCFCKQKYFCIPALLELQTQPEMGNVSACEDPGMRMETQFTRAFLTVSLQCTRWTWDMPLGDGMALIFLTGRRFCFPLCWSETLKQIPNYSLSYTTHWTKQFSNRKTLQ